MKYTVPLLFAVGCLTISPASARADEDYPTVELIHSPLPLYDFTWPDLWPRSIHEPDIVSGCASLIPFGDWKYEPNLSNVYDEPSWFRFTNYGVFHCAAIIQTADAQADLSDGRSKTGFFVRLGETSVEGKSLEVWTIQQGFVPGSNYTLLARPAVEGGLIGSFIMLQQICSKDDIRELPEGFDVLPTRYCSVDSRPELFNMAKRILTWPNEWRS